MKVLIVSQARMTSTRLPGKVLKSVLGKPLLEYHLERLKRVTSAQDVIVATTTKDTDGPVADLCQRLGVGCFRGSEDDVLSRFHGAAHAFNADVIVRVTADCPLIDPRVVDKVIRVYLENLGLYDYVSNTLVRSYPRGMDAEVFSTRVLDEAFYATHEQQDREHVTPFIYRHPERYRLGSVTAEKDLGSYRWTVDTPEDFELIRLILEELYPGNPRFGMEEVLATLAQHVDWNGINAHIEQKKLGM